eukprot:4744636-Pleurochrysis_carterae.AAC.2
MRSGVEGGAVGGCAPGGVARKRTSRRGAARRAAPPSAPCSRLGGSSTRGRRGLRTRRPTARSRMHGAHDNGAHCRIGIGLVVVLGLGLG